MSERFDLEAYCVDCKKMYGSGCYECSAKPAMRAVIAHYEAIIKDKIDAHSFVITESVKEVLRLREVIKQKDELLKEAKYLIDALNEYASDYDDACTERNACNWLEKFKKEG